MDSGWAAIRALSQGTRLKVQVRTARAARMPSSALLRVGVADGKGGAAGGEHPPQSWVSPQPLVCTLDADLLVSFPAHSDHIPRGECPVGGRTVALWGAGLALLRARATDCAKAQHPRSAQATATERATARLGAGSCQMSHPAMSCSCSHRLPSRHLSPPPPRGD